MTRIGLLFALDPDTRESVGCLLVRMVASFVNMPDAPLSKTHTTDVLDVGVSPLLTFVEKNEPENYGAFLP